MSQIATSADFFARTLPLGEEREHTHERTFAEARASWSPGYFAREQVRGLVRQLFLCDNDKRVRHVLFCTIDRETDIGFLTRLVAEGLALEKVGSVALMASYPNIAREDCRSLELREEDRRSRIPGLRHNALRLKENLWLVRSGSDPASDPSGASLGDLRREFDYSLVAGPTADSPDALGMLQMVDGLVLVISARYTRKAIARSAKRALESANARILGTVLTDRAFPVPASIYRHL